MSLDTQDIRFFDRGVVHGVDQLQVLCVHAHASVVLAPRHELIIDRKLLEERRDRAA